MKKLTMFAVAAFISMSVSAQDVFKQVSKVKSYKEANDLIKNGLSGMSAEEKAKCYNYLVDLSYDKIVKEQAVITSNQMAAQFNTKVEPYDTVGLYSAALKALKDGVLCDEFDMQPNEKGKVKPKFHKANSERLYGIRFHLVNGGIYYQNTDPKLSYEHLATYVESNDYPLFKDIDKSKDPYLTQMAYFAARDAYFAKEYDKAEKFADIAINDTAYSKEAMQVKLAVMQDQLKNHTDSVNYVNKLKDIYAKDENNDGVFGMICSMMTALNDKAGLEEFVQAKLTKDPNNFTALAMKGQSYMNNRQWDEAIQTLTKAGEVQPNNPAVLGSIGNCYMYKAQDAAQRASDKGGRIPATTENAIVDVYKQAISFLEKAKDADANMQFKNVWAYSLYTCYYRAYGEDNEKTKAAKLLTE